MPSKTTAAERNPLAVGCEGCFFLSTYFGCCDYLIETDKRRPCPGGKGCTVKTREDPREKPEKKTGEKRDWGGRPIGWDREKGLQLWLAGATYQEVADALGTSRTAVADYGKKYWAPLKGQRTRKPAAGANRAGKKRSWDTEKGYELWKSGATDRQIAEAVGIHQETVRGYRVKHWGGSNYKAEAKWDTEKGRELYRQGMSANAIARELGVSGSIVKYYVKKHWRGEG